METLNEPKNICLEDLCLGTAKVTVLETTHRSYGLDDWHWDALPRMQSHYVWMVTMQCHGKYIWGPFKQRKDAKKQYQGVSGINIFFSRIFFGEATDCYCSTNKNEEAKKEAEDCAIELIMELEGKGFKVELEFGKEKCNIENHYKWTENAPPEFALRRYEKRKYLQPRLKDIHI